MTFSPSHYLFHHVTSSVSPLSKFILFQIYSYKAYHNKSSSPKGWKDMIPSCFSLVKSFVVITTIRMTKAEETDITDLDVAKNWLCKTDHHSKIWKDRWVQRVSINISESGQEITRDINCLMISLKDNFHKLQETVCRLTRKYKICRGYSLRGARRFIGLGFYMQRLHKFSWGFSRERGKITIVKYPQRILK